MIIIIITIIIITIIIISGSSIIMKALVRVNHGQRRSHSCCPCPSLNSNCPKVKRGKFLTPAKMSAMAYICSSQLSGHSKQQQLLARHNKKQLLCLLPRPTNHLGHPDRGAFLTCHHLIFFSPELYQHLLLN